MTTILTQNGPRFKEIEIIHRLFLVIFTVKPVQPITHPTTLLAGWAYFKVIQEVAIH